MRRRLTLALTLAFVATSVAIGWALYDDLATVRASYEAQLAGDASWARAFAALHATPPPSTAESTAAAANGSAYERAAKREGLALAAFAIALVLVAGRRARAAA